MSLVSILLCLAGVQAGLVDRDATLNNLGARQIAEIAANLPKETREEKKARVKAEKKEKKAKDREAESSKEAEAREPEDNKK
ncbi:uncharacterized protein GGS22DRAFT_189212 [Annulohypoxylon maeteangense]|uniref:uncharacterized protein n=1 Tax=Annulohypoxylon maeteangense TaxID=1927788 RepID=UPI00200781EE|nr:uncharacterized protein GGS22DRAFT_189212 [Annulohypoxylon maeteangense]KAI0884082.1 hypothetical protein GGS22DRAFT_189212 [Annulohypoxylon maeteangense]